MTLELVKQNISNNFSSAAKTYNQYSELQKEVAAEVFFRIKNKIMPGHQILDLGCGTGYLAKIINAEMLLSGFSNPALKITQVDISHEMVAAASQIKNTKTIQADMEKLPLPYDSFDIVISSLAAQWGDLSKILREVRRVKKTTAPYIISTLGQESFKEIRQDFPEINLRNMHNIDSIKKKLEEAKIPNLFVKRQLIKKEYSTLLDFFYDLKNIGANTQEKKSTFTKSLVRKLKETKNYQLSWEVIYLQNFN
ncbi:MAG: methyltransferase domain-containing protein [Alphaproteobacteria bacterium]|jgi:malonyl-CoA O-methyltransferase|nr:methyltransferase domain-containing protein [Alphaproteobacteria bacterium]